MINVKARALLKNSQKIAAWLGWRFADRRGCRNSLILDVSLLTPLSGDESLSFIKKQLELSGGALICVKPHSVINGYNALSQPRHVKFEAGKMYRTDIKSDFHKPLSPASDRALEKTVTIGFNGEYSYFLVHSIELNGVDLLKLDLSNFAILSICDYTAD